ncbi:O-antigen ligase domain-containing protein [Desulfovibrio subterraneus]|uniref:O-antigen polymerase n=1 Tax=Desulfovibrio subterraneus TaxID=2718620 RepID=A0A7J0BL58_9BACT|nr:O-antigen ligase domain-containing protein [Desulfovibrio subterraneus]GFM34473.1 hypothetical protein DSM101010T_28380 [Desulfovibrio subterraneus]
MNPIAHLAMLGWIPAVLLLFSLLPPRRAVIAAFIIAWLFLPVARYDIPVLPDYTKMSATCAGVLIAAFIFDNQRLMSFRASAVDTPMLLWLIAPFISSMSNDLGLWDATAALFQQTVTWGMPYFIGRIYLSDMAGLRDLARGIFIGGLVYIPLCLYESRMSPQLHRMIYGFMAHYDFSQTYRLGGWRPMVFMSHGIMVGVWMMAATLNGFWMYRMKALEDLKGKLHLKLLIPVMLFTAVWIRSFGALLLLLLGLGLLFLTIRIRTRLVMAAFLMIPPVFMFSAVIDQPLGQTAVDIIESVNADRAASLKFRVDNEHILVAKAMQRPAFGWGGWGRARVYNEFGEDISVTDSLWVITLGNYGLFGLATMSLVFFLPAYLFLKQYRAMHWHKPHLCHAASLTVMLSLYSVDNLINAMENPIFIFTAGALTGAMLQPQQLEAPEAAGQTEAASPFRGYEPRFI